MITPPDFYSENDHLIEAVARASGILNGMEASILIHPKKVGRGLMVFAETKTDVAAGIIMLFREFKNADNGWIMMLWDTSKHSPEEIDAAIAACRAEITLHSAEKG